MNNGQVIGFGEERWGVKEIILLLTPGKNTKVLSLIWSILFLKNKTRNGLRLQLV